MLQRPVAEVDGIGSEELFALALGPLPGRAALAEALLGDAAPRAECRSGGWRLAEIGQAFHVFVLVPGGGGLLRGRPRVFFSGVLDTTSASAK